MENQFQLLQAPRGTLLSFEKMYLLTKKNIINILINQLKEKYNI